MTTKIKLLSLLLVSVLALAYAEAASALTAAEYTALLTSLEQRVEQLEAEVRLAEQARLAEEKDALTVRLQTLRADTERLRGVRVEEAAANPWSFGSGTERPSARRDQSRIQLSLGDAGSGRDRIVPPASGGTPPAGRSGSETGRNSGIITTNPNTGRDAPRSVGADKLENPRADEPAFGSQTVSGFFRSIETFFDRLIPFIVGLAVFAVIWGLFGYLAHAENEEKRAEARRFLVWGVIGVFAMLSLWGFVNMLIATFRIETRIDKSDIPTVPRIVEPYRP